MAFSCQVNMLRFKKGPAGFYALIGSIKLGKKFPKLLRWSSIHTGWTGFIGSSTEEEAALRVL